MCEDGSHWYDHAQICKNGHLITINCDISPEQKRTFCPQCGEATITQCPECHSEILGCYCHTQPEQSGYDPFTEMKYYEDQTYQITDVNSYVIPSFCHNCGSPYPWTQKLLDASSTIFDLMDDLSPEQRKKLKSIFPDLICDVPSTASSAVLTKISLSKVCNTLLIDALKTAASGAIVSSAKALLGW